MPVLTPAQIAVFAMATVVLAFISRGSLLRPRSHGFLRFFVWEAILLMTTVNAPNWFRQPWAWHQIISWLLLVSSLIPLGLGLRELRRGGSQGRGTRSEPELVGIERTTRLVHEGIFRYIRHPMYASLLLLTWGVFFKLPSLVGGGLASLASLGVMRMAAVEEDECVRVFGRAYIEYMKGTRRFIPHVI